MRPARSRATSSRWRPARTRSAPTSAASPRRRRQRSEEHTSELQSLTNLVCRLLLEKKKKAGRRRAGDLLSGGGAGRIKAASGDETDSRQSPVDRCDTDTSQLRRQCSHNTTLTGYDQ